MSPLLLVPESCSSQSCRAGHADKKPDSSCRLRGTLSVLLSCTLLNVVCLKVFKVAARGLSETEWEQRGLKGGWWVDQALMLLQLHLDHVLASWQQAAVSWKGDQLKYRMVWCPAGNARHGHYFRERTKPNTHENDCRSAVTQS